MEPRPVARRFRLLAPGRVLLVFGLVSLLPALALGGAATLLPALCAALLCAGGLLSWLNLRALAPEPPAPCRAFVLQLVRLEVPVRSRAAWLHARDVILHQGDQGRDRARPVAWIPSVAPGERRIAPCSHRMIDRGRFRSHRLTLASSFPLGLIEHRRSFELDVDFVAMPRLGTVRNLEDRLPSWRGPREARRTYRRGMEDFHGLREWREGESAHLVHWRATARHGEPLVRELRGEERPPVHVVLSTLADVHLSGRRNRSFEEAVSLAATVAESFLRRRLRVKFSLAGPEPASLSCGRGRNALVGILTRLAEVKPSPREGGDDRSALPALPPLARGEVRVVIASARGAASGLALDDRTLVLDVDDRSVEDVFSRARLHEPDLPRLSA
jgi:uncharacterized protein (DUF58 family)